MNRAEGDRIAGLVLDLVRLVVDEHGRFPMYRPDELDRVSSYCPPECRYSFRGYSDHAPG